MNLKKFRTTYFSQSVKDDINDEIVLTRMRKETREMNDQLDLKTGANKKGKVVVIDKATELAQKKAQEIKEREKRHMVRAFAGIDRKAKQPANHIFQTIYRDQAEKLWE